MIKDFVPARASLASGVVIKQHILERNKYPQPQVNNYSTIANVGFDNFTSALFIPGDTTVGTSISYPLTASGIYALSITGSITEDAIDSTYYIRLYDSNSTLIATLDSFTSTPFGTFSFTGSYSGTIPVGSYIYFSADPGAGTFQINNFTTLLQLANPYYTPYTTQDISVSGTVAPQWNDYNPGTIENFSGGTGGTMDMFNGLSTSPVGTNGTGPNNIFNITQSWYETANTPLGPVLILHDAQDEFYDGEFSGSILTVTTQSLNQSYPLDNIASYYKQVHYYGTSSVEDNTFEGLFLNNITSPKTGSILFYNEPTMVLGSPSYQLFNTKYLKIAKIDCSGSNNTNILGDITSAKIYNDVAEQYVNYNLTVLNELPNYYIYEVATSQSYAPASFPNQVLNYYASESKTTSQGISTPLVGTYPIISNYQTELGDILNYFNLSTGLYTLGDTPNSQLIISASVTNAGDASAGSGNAFIEVLRNGVRTQLASSLSFTTTSPTTVKLSTTYYGLVGDQIYVRATKNGAAPTTDYTVTNVQLLVTQSRAVSSSNCLPVIFEPYFTQPNYYYSDYNPTMNNIDAERLSTIYDEVSYYPGITTPTNFDVIISGSAVKAAVQDSNYTSKRITDPRYNGVKSTNQYLNIWTPGDTGNYGKTPSTQNLKTMVAYCDWIAGWPPDRMNASAIHIQYLIKSDGSIVIPNVSENSLYENKGTFESGERLIIEPRTISSGQPIQYRNILRGGTRIEPILYTQIGHTPATWTSSLNLWNENVNYPVSDVTRLSVLNPLSSTNTIAQLLQFPGSSQTLGITTAGASQGWTILYDPASTTFGSGNYDYSVSTTPNPLAEGTNLIVDAQIKIQNLSATSPSVVRIDLRNSFIGANPPLETQLISLSPFETKIVTFYKSLTPGVDYDDTNNKGDIHFKVENDGPAALCCVLSDSNETYFNVKQSPLPNPLPPVLTGSNRIWSYPTSSTYNQHSSSAEGIIFIPNTTSSLNIYYNTPGIRQANITQSGFNSITLDWNVQYGDEFRFEGSEDRVYMVKHVYEPTNQSPGRISNTGSLEIHLNSPIPSQSLNLDHFVIRRYVDDPSAILMEGFKPINTSGPFIVRPEYLVPELDKRVDEFILDLTQKGLL
jgi:hypothetical protein